ncbi:MAG: hypothetical protein M0P59_00380 [Gallionella sp.]|jgi:ubiquinol-cytochrome c reductase iron-sulfur subunit|nr:hypothetical protein [Gallionella sp.]MCK9352596.1 hypothetical protein [Gallionella sp.]
MNFSKIIRFAIGMTVCGCALATDDFPEGYIKRQLEAAKTPVDVNIADLKSGELMSVQYLNRPVWIYRRTPLDKEYLTKHDSSLLADPEGKNSIPSIEASYGSTSSYVWSRLLLAGQSMIDTTPSRSLNDEYFVVGGWSPLSGCMLTYQSSEERPKSTAIFHDPCSGASFDTAGRILKGTQTSYNLYLLPYKFINKTTLSIGLNNSMTLPEIRTPARAYPEMTPTERLITACRYNDLEAAKQALKDGANANYFEIGKGSPLDAAIIGSSMKVIDFLIANGAKPTPNSLNAARFIGRTDLIQVISKMQ